MRYRASGSCRSSFAQAEGSNLARCTIADRVLRWNEEQRGSRLFRRGFASLRLAHADAAPRIAAMSVAICSVQGRTVLDVRGQQLFPLLPAQRAAAWLAHELQNRTLGIVAGETEGRCEDEDVIVLPEYLYSALMFF